MSHPLHRLIIISHLLACLYACQDESIAESSRLEYESASIDSSSFSEDLPEPNNIAESSLPAYVSQEEHSSSKQDA